ncbi:protein Niban 2-like isoform X3 [Ascaphus truei]|uniref:protein Niban 2-like isoform X3 n=1 Tax=Ascaphus truei TaxID=8439 RepID=UPI003F591C05
MVHEQARLFYEGLEQHSAERRAEMESQIRTDMDQIISCKEHVSSKIRAAVLPKAELCVRNHVQSHIPSILDALMVPTSQGFSEVRDLLFRETTEMNMNLVNEQGKDKLGEHMDKLSQLAYHPVKMQPCYEKMEQLHLEGLQQRFDVGSPAVFRQRAQILMREQTDNAVYTLEQLVHQELSKSEGGEDLCKDIQRVLERVLKKYDYDSSSVRKKFFQEALLQILIPFLLKKLAPTCRGELPRYQELIFEELSRYVLVENTYEEVVLQTVMRDIMQAVKDAATQRKHNLYRDSMVMHNSDPNLHLLGEGTPIDWSEEFADPNEPPSESRKRRARQVVSLIQDDEPGSPGSCQEAPAHESIPEEGEPSDVVQIRGMLVKEFDVAVPGVPAGDVPDYRAPEEEVTGKFEPSAQTQRERLPGDGQGPQEEEVDHCDTRLVQKEKVTHEDLKVAPEALARGDLKVAPEALAHGDLKVAPAALAHGDLKVALDTMEHHDLHVAPEALAHHDLHVAPEALAHHDLHVAPEALAHHDLHVAPEALAHRDLQVAPEALAHHDLQVAPEALAHRDLQVVPEALAHRDLQVAPEPLAHRDLQVAPEALAHRDLQVAPEALAHRDLQVAPQALAHRDLQVAPEALAHRDLQVAPEALAHHDLQVAWRCHASQEDAITQPRAQTLPCEMPAERITPILTVPEEESQSLQTQLPPAYLVHSTPDDSGFQSPLSEEEEGEGLREVPVPVPRHKDEVITPF